METCKPRKVDYEYLEFKGIESGIIVDTWNFPCWIEGFTIPTSLVSGPLESEKLKQILSVGSGNCIGITKMSAGFIGSCTESSDECLVSSNSLDCQVSQICCDKQGAPDMNSSQSNR